MTLCPIQCLVLLFHHMSLKEHLPNIGFCNYVTEVVNLYLLNMPSEDPLSVLIFAK